MYEQYWGLSSSPFDPRHLPEEAMRSTPYEEAIARMLYIVEHNRPGGMLLGCSGSGKTTVLKYLAKTISGINRRLALVNLSGIEGPEFLSLLAEAFSIGITEEATPPMLRRELRDFLSGSVSQGCSIVLVCDDVDQGGRDVIEHLMWLSRTADMTGANVNYLFAANKENARQMSPEIFNLCELRVDLEPWSNDQACDYLDNAMRTAGAQGPIFTPEAAQRINELACGLPGPLARLAELSLLAAAGDDLENITPETIDSVFSELYPMGILTS